MILIDEAPWILYPALLTGLLIALVFRAVNWTEPTGETRIRWSEIGWVALITVAAFALRLKGITFGFPENFHPDEIPKLNAIERMRAAGDLNPRYFLHPSLLLYATHFSERFGELMGWWENTRTGLNFAGRCVSLVAGTLTIPALWAFSRFATGRSPVALLSAALLAVFPLHVTCSRYLKEDALVAFWMVLTAAIVMYVVTAPVAKRWWLILAGVAAGVAASSKYNGLVFFMFVAVAPWVRSRSFKPDSQLLAPVAVALLASVVGFLACTPYAVLDWPTFIDDFMYEKRHMRKGHMVVISPWTHYWSYQVGRSLVPGIGLVNSVLALMAFGLALGVLLLHRSRLAFMLILAAGMTYLPAELVKAKPEPQPDRYLMVFVPWCAVAISMLVFSINRRRMRLAQAMVAGLLVFIPGYRSIELSNDMRDDTRVQMARWIEGNIPTGSRIAVDYLWYGPTLPPERFYTESLHGSQILEKIRVGELRRAGFDYVIVSSFFRDRFFRQRDNLGAFRELFRRLDRELPTMVKMEAESGPYGFHNPTLTLYALRPPTSAVPGTTGTPR